MFIKCSLLITCLLLQACSMNFTDWGRTPAAVSNFDPFIAKMTDFKNRILGSEKDAACSKEDLDKDFNKLMASIKRDSCSISNYTLDREEFNEKACPKVKTEGYFDKLVKTTIEEEKKKKPLSFFQNKVDPKFVAINKEAQQFLLELGPLIHNESFPREERAALVASYIENVLMPIRSVVIVMRSYLPKEDDGKIFYQSLQPYLTHTFFTGLTEQEKVLVTQGPNEKTNPFYLEAKEQANGSYRLTFSETDIIRRDVLTLLKAPTAKNYVLALKWMTLHMMLSQVHLYQTILGDKGEADIPKSCQNHFNGNLPAKFKFNVIDGYGDLFLDSMLGSHGLTFKEGSDEVSELARALYYDYYLQNVTKDPTKMGYSGMIPFENFKNALKSTDMSVPAAVQPEFDDVAHFQSVISFKMAETQRVFRQKLNGHNIIVAGYDTFQKMQGQFGGSDVAEVKISADTVKQIYPGKQNLSPYLLEVMQANGLIDYSELITERMKKKFVGRKVLIDFPSLYSSPVWRDWSLRTLADVTYAQRNAPANSKFGTIVKNACMVGTRRGSELNKICEGNIISNLANYLGEFRTGDTYVPTKRLEDQKFQDVYPFLRFVWTNLRDELNLLPDAAPFELNFLKDQMDAGNPWARLKFSYMVALDQLEHKQEGILPKYDRKNPFTKNNDGVRCESNNVYVQYTAIKNAGKVLGLDKPLSYNHASKVLSPKERIEVWKNILDEVHQGNAQLFSVRNGSQNYYTTTENISYKTLLSESAALSTGAQISQKAVSEIKLVTQKSDAKLAAFFFQLYNMKDVTKQQKLFEDFSKANGIDSTYSAKMGFLALDNAYKKPIYKDLMRQAAQTRKLQILSQLDSFCKMDINDAVVFKNIFYTTTKAQNDLNKSAGLPGVPEEVLSKIQEMTPAEWRDMWWGIGSGVAGMAAIVIGGACTTFSGGICLPLGGVMAAAGMSALGIQVKLTANEIDRKIESDASEKQIKLMEDLGFANIGSSDEVHRSYAWAAFEAISIFPLIGIATRSAILGPKLAIVATKSLMRQTGATAFKAAAKSAAQAEETRAAQFLIGLESVSKNIGVSQKTLDIATDKIAKIKVLYKTGAIDLETMVAKTAEILDPIKRAKLALARTARAEIGNTTVVQSQKVVDNKVSKMTADYFSDNPKEMLSFIQGYSGERLNKAVRVMAELNSTDRIGGRIPIFSGVRDWYLRMRNESLAKNAAKILRIEQELIALGGKPGQLEGFINRNIESLTDILTDIPFRKREIPYFIFVQGMPEFNFVKGSRIPILSHFSQGQTLRRIFLARSRLVEESFKTQARGILKLKRFAHTDTTYNVFKSFQMSIGELANTKTGAEAAAVMSDYRKLEEKIARKLYTQFTSKEKSLQYKSFQEMITSSSGSKGKAEFDAFKEMVFNPKTLKEKANVEAIWESVPADELLGMKEVGEAAHKAAQQLSKYSDVDSFERYLNALKLLTINRNSAVLEVM